MIATAKNAWHVRLIKDRRIGSASVIGARLSARYSCYACIQACFEMVNDFIDSCLTKGKKVRWVGLLASSRGEGLRSIAKSCVMFGTDLLVDAAKVKLELGHFERLGVVGHE